MARIAPQSSIYCFRSLSRYSNTRVRDLSVWTMSWRVTGNRRLSYYCYDRLLSRDPGGQDSHWQAFVGNMGKMLIKVNLCLICRKYYCASVAVDMHRLQSNPVGQLMGLIHEGISEDVTGCHIKKTEYLLH